MARLNRQQVLNLTGGQPEALRELTEYSDGYDAVELWRVSPRAREALYQLVAFSRVPSWWREFHRWRSLEDAGLLEVLNRRDPATGKLRRMGEWWPVLTEIGWELAQELVGLMRDGRLD